MKNTLETRLGLFFALALIAAVMILETLGGREVFKSGLELTARFSNVAELKVGDTVKMAGVQIGRVKRIQFDRDKILVTMKITDPKAEVRTDCQATIKFTGLMGQNYVAIDFGSGKGSPATPGTMLAAYEQPDFSVLMTKLDNVAGGIKKITDNFSDANLNDILLPFTDFLKESKPHLMGILSNAHGVSDAIAAKQGTAGMLIYDDRLYNSALSAVTNLNETAAEVRGAVDQAKGLVADVSAGKGTVGKLLKEDTVHTELSAAMTNLKEILQKINQGQGSVGRLVNDASLFNNAKMTLQKLDKATEGLEDQGPLSVIGIMANSLF
jgi:phospholipid/cholesterol/gamma-HCH transport system substrate-binding protein